jgi:hypothetical protein
LGSPLTRPSGLLESGGSCSTSLLFSSPSNSDPLKSSSPEGQVKDENENREYESSCEESVGEEDNREVKDDPLNSSSPEGRDKGENENREYESSCEDYVYWR